MLSYHKGEFEQAEEHFGKVHASDPDDPFVGFEYAETLRKLDRNDEALKVLEKVVERDPGFVSAFYSLGMLYNQTRQREKAVQTLKRFSELKPQELAVGSYGVVSPYAGMGKYSTALAADGLPIPPSSMSPAPRVLFSPDLKTIDCPLKAWTWAGGKVTVPGIAVGDLDGDGDQDVVLAGAGTNGGTVVLFNDGKGRFTIGQRLADKGVVPCLGDIDNDGDLDLWLGRAGQDLLFLNDGKGKFTQAPQQPEPAGEHLTTCARLVDLDSDGDLDLLGDADQERHRAARCDASGRLEQGLQQQPRRHVHRGGQGAGARLAPTCRSLPSSPTISTTIATSTWRSSLRRSLPSAGRISGWAGTVCSTPRRRIWICPARSVRPRATPSRRATAICSSSAARSWRLFHNQGRWEFQRDTEFSSQHGSLGGTGGQFVDIDNDGDLDIVIADAHRPTAPAGPRSCSTTGPPARFVDAATADPGNLLASRSCHGRRRLRGRRFQRRRQARPPSRRDGRIAGALRERDPGRQLAGARPAGQAHAGPDQPVARLGHRCPGRAPVGKRHPAIRRGHARRRHGDAAAARPGRARQHSSVDWLRVQWPDSLLQAELEVAGNQVVAIPETCRRTSSCPHLFAWDGRQFAFVSDFGGVGGLGYRTGPSSFARPDPTEYVVLPALAPRDGDYVLQVVEPLEEIVYFDEAKLIAVDHPAGTTIHPNELAAVSADPPPFEVFCYSQSVKPARAVDDHGRDVTEALQETDRIYASPTERDGRFAGYARDHFVELDFADRLGSLPPGARWVLFLDGWVEYSTSTSNFAASQAGLRLKAPSVSVLREWPVGRAACTRSAIRPGSITR